MARPELAQRVRSLKWRVSMRRWSIAMIVAALAAPLAARQTFRAGAELVSVYATVTDKEAHLITDLTKDDFVVSDEGKPQPITLFSNEIQPITVVVMLDRSGSMVEHTGLVRDAAEQFVRKLLPDDRARIGSLSRRSSSVRGNLPAIRRRSRTCCATTCKVLGRHLSGRPSIAVSPRS